MLQQQSGPRVFVLPLRDAAAPEKPRWVRERTPRLLPVVPITGFDLKKKMRAIQPILKGGNPYRIIGKATIKKMHHFKIGTLKLELRSNKFLSTQVKHFICGSSPLPTHPSGLQPFNLTILPSGWSYWLLPLDRRKEISLALWSYDSHHV